MLFPAPSGSRAGRSASPTAAKTIPKTQLFETHTVTVKLYHHRMEVNPRRNAEGMP